MKKEDELILFMSRLTDWEKNKDQVADLLRDKLDWGYIILNCRCNKVSNIFFHHLCVSGFYGNLKKQVFKIYLENYKFTEFKLEILRKNFYCICEKLNKLNVQYAIIKGFALSDLIYFEHGNNLRDFNDIDILVKESDLQHVCSTLQQLGYIQGEYDTVSENVNPASREEVIRMKMTSHQIVPFCKVVTNGFKAKIPIEVDINFTIFEGGKILPLISTDKILEKTIEVKDEMGNMYQTLNPYFMFIQIVYHFYKEYNYEFMQEEYNDLTLQKLCDIREFILKYFPVINQNNLADIINMYKLNDAIYNVLNLLKNFYDDLELNDFLYTIKNETSTKENETKLSRSKIIQSAFHSDFNL